MAAIEDDRILQQDAQVIIGFFLLRGLPGEGRHLHPGARRQLVERLLEIKVLTLHDKLEDITAFVALTEAAPGTGLRPHDKGRCMLVIVEWTKACIVPACMTQLDPRLRDKVDNIYFGFDLIND